MEQTEHAAAVAEALSALERGVDPEEALHLVRSLREHAEKLELDLVRQARSHGLSWSRIGSVYGLTKQGAQQRFRRDG